MDLAGLGAIGGIHDSALFHLGNLRGDANHDARMYQPLPVMGLLDEVVQHLLGDFEVSDDAVFHGLNGDDVAGRAAEHLLGFFAHGLNLTGQFIDGYDGRFVDDDALALGIDQCVGRSLFCMFSSDLAIDLGTANTLVYAKGKGIVVNEPSIVAINKLTGEVEAVGKEAKEMLGRTPGNIVAIKPMKDGVIADFKVTEKMLNYFIQKAHNRKMLVHPRIVIGVPSEITQVEKRAVMDSAYRAKASEVHLVEQAMGPPIAPRLPITEPTGNMVVDIGAGPPRIGVILPTRLGCSP